MAKRAAAVKAVAKSGVTKKALGTKSGSPIANGASKATGRTAARKAMAEASPKIVTAEAAAASNSVNTAQERRVCLRCNGPLTDDDLDMDRGHCDACRDMSRRVARWVQDEKLIAAYPEKYRGKKLSLGDDWEDVLGDLGKLINQPTFVRSPKPQSPCELLLSWLKRRTGKPKQEIYFMTWEEVRSLLREEVEKIETEDATKTGVDQVAGLPTEITPYISPEDWRGILKDNRQPSSENSWGKFKKEYKGINSPTSGTKGVAFTLSELKRSGIKSERFKLL